MAINLGRFVKSKMPFIVLTVSRRTGWEQIAVESIRSQTTWKQEKPFIWNIVTENSPDTHLSTIKMMCAQIGRAPEKKRASNLNASLNAGLRRINDYFDTPYVIFYQDFIKLPPDCFEKLLAVATPNTFVTTATINADGNKDLRYTGLDCVRPCRPEEWEANVAIAPMAMIRELGGFDEEYDNGWSWDNVNLAERAELLGAKFLLDETNSPQLLPHDKPSEELLSLSNGEFHAQRMREIRAGNRPLKLNFL